MPFTTSILLSSRRLRRPKVARDWTSFATCKVSTAAMEYSRFAALPRGAHGTVAADSRPGDFHRAVVEIRHGNLARSIRTLQSSHGRSCDSSLVCRNEHSVCQSDTSAAGLMSQQAWPEVVASRCFSSLNKHFGEPRWPSPRTMDNAALRSGPSRRRFGPGNVQSGPTLSAKLAL
jgi:hypothetical protein